MWQGQKTPERHGELKTIGGLPPDRCEIVNSGWGLRRRQVYQLVGCSITPSLGTLASNLSTTFLPGETALCLIVGLLTKYP
jgi:hypothetical protein